MRTLSIFCTAIILLGTASAADRTPPLSAAKQPPSLSQNTDGADIEALAFLVLMQAAKSAQEDVRAVMASVKAINETKAKLRDADQDRQKLADPCDGKSIVSWRDCIGRIRVATAKMELAALDVSKAAVETVLAESRELMRAIEAASKRQGQVAGESYLGDPCKHTAVAAWRICLKRIEQRLAGRAPDEASKRELNTMLAQIKADIDSMSEMGEMESLRLQMAMDRMSKMMSTLSNLLKKISDTASRITQNLK
jgi:hypothetical protein